MSNKWIVLSVIFAAIFVQNSFGQSKQYFCAYMLPFSQEDAPILREILVRLDYQPQTGFKGVIFKRCGTYENEVCLTFNYRKNHKQIFQLTDAGLLAYIRLLEEASLLNYETLEYRESKDQKD